MQHFQVPLALGFAMTAHKAQGLTLPHIIVDHAGCKGTEPPYVMASRATSLEGLLVMQPFNMSKISCHRSQEAWDEFDRLSQARWQTISIHGSPQEQALARQCLGTAESSQSTKITEIFSGGTSTNPNEVARVVAQLQNDRNQAKEGSG